MLIFVNFRPFSEFGYFLKTFVPGLVLVRKLLRFCDNLELFSVGVGFIGPLVFELLILACESCL